MIVDRVVLKYTTFLVVFHVYHLLRFTALLIWSLEFKSSKELKKKESFVVFFDKPPIKELLRWETWEVDFNFEERRKAEGKERSLIQWWHILIFQPYIFTLYPDGGVQSGEKRGAWRHASMASLVSAPALGPTVSGPRALFSTAAETGLRGTGLASWTSQQNKGKASGVILTSLSQDQLVLFFLIFIFERTNY